jgi:hypothetical protein
MTPLHFNRPLVIVVAAALGALSAVGCGGGSSQSTSSTQAGAARSSRPQQTTPGRAEPVRSSTEKEPGAGHKSGRPAPRRRDAERRSAESSKPDQQEPRRHSPDAVADRLKELIGAAHDQVTVVSGSKARKVLRELEANADKGDGAKNDQSAGSPSSVEKVIQGILGGAGK